MRDLFSNVKVMPAVYPITVTDDTAQVGPWIETTGFGSLFFAIQSGTIADANATLTPLVEESDSSDGSHSDATAVADADLEGTEAGAAFAAADDQECRKIGYKGNKKYVRLTLTPAANTDSLPMSALAILGNPEVLPQSTQATP